MKTLVFCPVLWYHFLMGNEKNTAASTPEMVTISRAEYDSQQAQLTELKLQNQWLLEQLGLARKRQFGASSERLQEGLMDQLSLMANEAEAYAYGTKNATAEQVAVKAHARKRHSGNVLDIVPEGTPTEVVEHRLCEEERTCDTCGAVMEEIGKEVRRSLKMEPARFWIREDVYYTYACKQCEAETGEGNLRKTPKQPTLCPGSFASPEAVAHIMTQKFVMYAPLYRLEQEFQRQVLKEPGRTSTSKSYMWLYRTSGCAEYPIVLYEYQPSRKAEHAQAFLKDFSGWLHADGYQGYHKLPENIRVVGCWAHARRKFDETLPKEKRQESLAATGECYCTRLFQLEQALVELTPEERYTKRLELEKPVLDALLAWANETSAKTAPKSALGKALHYLREQWPYLVRYLEDGRLELSNNRAERSIKPFVMGRKNWLFSNTPAGAQSSAVIYSLIETAKENDLDPYRYLVWLLNHAPGLSRTDEVWAESFLPVNAPQECKIPKP